VDVFTQLLPALHGLYRAISSTSLTWTITQWTQLTKHLHEMCTNDVVDRLNQLLAEVLMLEEMDVDVHRFVETFLARYVSRGRPLSGYFIVCCIIETEWTILAQALTPAQENDVGSMIEAAAANQAWNYLMQNAALEIELKDKETKATLKATIDYALQVFNDLLVQIQDMDVEPSLETYTWETMSESLV
jgi:phosphatidylinositol 4-kinase A